MVDYTKMEGTYNPASLSTLSGDIREEIESAYNIALGNDSNSWKLADRHRNLKSSLTRINDYVADLEGDELEVVRGAIGDLVGITQNNATYQKHMDRLRDGDATDRGIHYSTRVFQESDDLLDLADVVNSSIDSKYASAVDEDSNTIYTNPSFWQKAKTGARTAAAGLALIAGLGATYLSQGCKNGSETLSGNPSENYEQASVSPVIFKRTPSGYVAQSKKDGVTTKKEFTSKIVKQSDEKRLKLAERKVIDDLTKEEGVINDSLEKKTSKKVKPSSSIVKRRSSPSTNSLGSNYAVSSFVGAGSEGFNGDLQLNHTLNDDYSAVGHFSTLGDSRFLTIGLKYGNDKHIATALVGAGFDFENEIAPVIAGRYRFDSDDWLALANARFGGDTDNAEFDNGFALMAGRSFNIGKTELNAFAGPSYGNDGFGAAVRLEAKLNKDWGVVAKADSSNSSGYLGVTFGESPAKTFAQPFGTGFIETDFVDHGVSGGLNNNNNNNDTYTDGGNTDTPVDSPVDPPVEEQDGGRGDRDGGDDVSSR